MDVANLLTSWIGWSGLTYDKMSRLRNLEGGWEAWFQADFCAYLSTVIGIGFARETTYPGHYGRADLRLQDAELEVFCEFKCLYALANMQQMYNDIQADNARLASIQSGCARLMLCWCEVGTALHAQLLTDNFDVYATIPDPAGGNSFECLGIAF